MKLDGYDRLDVYAGKLEKKDNKNAKDKSKAGGKQKEEPNKLQGYFEDMEKKQTLTMTKANLQRKLEENRGRRNIMKSQFGQFSSFPAVQLIEEGVVESVHIGGKKIDDIIKKCKYLFYEIKADDTKDGGYKIELSFEDKQQAFCDVVRIVDSLLEEGSKQVGNANQSILSTFEISN